MKMKTKDKTKQKDNKPLMKRWWFWPIVGLGICIVFILVVIFGIGALLALSQYHSSDWSYLTKAINSHSGLIGALCGLGIIGSMSATIFLYVKFAKPNFGANIRRSKSKEYGDARFLIDEHQKVTSWEYKDFNNVYPLEDNKTGWVVKAKYDEETNKTGYHISVLDKKDGHHHLVIGATASGKTQMTILQSIAYNAQIQDLKKKPSMVIFDPKGELASKEAKLLEANGYELLVFNLRDTFHSSTWNPLYLSTYKYFLARKIQKELEAHKANMEEQEIADKQTEIVQLDNDCSEGIVDIANAIYTDKNQKDPFWQNQAKQAFICAYYLCLEKITDDFIDNKTYEEIDWSALETEYKKVNLPSLAIALANTKELKDYFVWIDSITDINKKLTYTTRQSYISGANVFNSSEGTLGSVMSTVANGMEQYKQPTIQNITLTNEIELDKLCMKDKPTALFIIAPDEKENTYKFATLLVDQIYKASISVASSCEGQKLPRELMYFLDEFGNIPPIPKFDTMVTVSRSRGIYFCIAIQGFDQIEANYGKDKVKTIRENMVLHTYVKSTDKETNQYYSERAGTYTIEKSSASKSYSQESKTNTSTSTNLEKMELLSFNQVAENDNRNGWVLVFKANTNVAWIQTDAFWKSKDLKPYVVDEFNSILPNRIFDLNLYTYLVLSQWSMFIAKQKYIANLEKYKNAETDKDRKNIKEKLEKSPCYNQADLDAILHKNSVEPQQKEAEKKPQEKPAEAKKENEAVVEVIEKSKDKMDDIAEQVYVKKANVYKKFKTDDVDMQEDDVPVELLETIDW